MIPKIIHGNWFNRSRPSPMLAACRASVIRLHPDWQHRVIFDPILSRCSEPEAARTFATKGGLYCESVEWLFRDLYSTDPTLEVAPHYDLLRKNGEASGNYVWLSDFVRLLQLYEYGGFWLDFDMYAVQPLDRFINDDFVVGGINKHLPSEAILAARPLDRRVRELIEWMATNRTNSMNLGGYCIGNALPFYPAEYFVPHARDERGEALYRHTENTHTVHCWGTNRYDLDRLETIGAQLRNKAQIE